MITSRNFNGKIEPDLNSDISSSTPIKSYKESSF